MDRIEVHDWSELWDAWLRQTAGDLRIEVKNWIRVPAGSWLKPTESHGYALEIQGESGLGIQFGQVYLVMDERPGMNGLQFRGRSLRVADLSLSDFHASGAVLRADAPCEQVVVDRVNMRDIGQVSYPPLREPVSSAADAVITQGVGVFHSGCTVEILDCTFDRVGRSSHTWNHCVYCTTDVVRVVGTTFRKTGSPFAILSRKARAMVTGCTVEDPQVCDHPQYQLNQPARTAYIWGFYGEAAQYGLMAINNRFSGTWNRYLTLDGELDPRKFLFRNDISGLETTGDFSTVKDGSGYWKTMTKKQWQELGCDS